MIDIIERLDKEGIHLQETILNLENQGYEEIYKEWIGRILEEALRHIVFGLTMKQLRKEGLL